MTLGNDNGTDGQTDRQSATQYAAPPREEGRIKRKMTLNRTLQLAQKLMLVIRGPCQVDYIRGTFSRARTFDNGRATPTG